MPEAVVRGRDGYLRVFYDRLGLTFETYKHWVASGARIPSAAGLRHTQLGGTLRRNAYLDVAHRRRFHVELESF